MNWFVFFAVLYGIGICMTQHVTRRAKSVWIRALCSTLWPGLLLVVLFFIAHETFFPGAYEGEEDE